jgi:hypothetical protein
MAKTALEQGAEFFAASGELNFVPWFRDDAKLLAAVMRRARENSSYAAQVIEAVTALVGGDKRLRGLLRKAMIPAKASKPGRSKNPLWLLMWIVSELDMLYQQKVTKMKAREIVAKRHNLSTKRIEALESRGRKQRVLEFETNSRNTAAKA